MKEKMKPTPKAIMFSIDEVAVINQFRMLWEQHDTWTWSAINNIVFGLPSADAVTNRLLRNPEDFEAALQPYFGIANAAHFRDLLTEHLVVAGDLVKAAKSGNSALAAQIEKAWYDNANEIAVFLASLSPYWAKEQWRQMMYTHLALVKAEATGLLSGQYDAAIAAYDQNEQHTLGMADVMSSGIIRQFNI